MPPLHDHPEVDCEVLADNLGASPGPSESPPPPPTRAASWLEAGNRLFTRLDTAVERWLPREMNPLAQLGAATNAMLVLATLSGVLLLFWYSASVQSAWHSLAVLGPRSLGGLMRSIHRYSSDLVMLLVLAHALRSLLARKFADARWLAWVSGIALLGLVWFIGWTGYWLVWDERAQLLARDSVRALDALPIFGEPLLRLFTADRTVPSLLFFVVFFLHMVLPLGIAAGLGLHLARLSRTQLLPDWRLCLWLTGAVVTVALISPATNAAPAQMTLKPAAFTMDWWYLWPLAITSRLSGAGLWLAAGLSAIGLLAVPWWLARRRPRPVYQAKINISRCFACTLCSHDCPFGAITMVPRTDGKPFPSQAQIDPDRCIGCGICAGACDTQGIGLTWFDAQQVTRELEAFVTAESSRGVRPALALACAQSDGGWELFDHVAWSRRLPGYTVRPLPCAGWVEPKLIERLITKGAAAVLVVGCSSSEAFCKEGTRWLAARLDGTREPAFRPQRADPGRMLHMNYDPLRPQVLTSAAHRLRAGDSGMTTSGPRSPWGGIAAAMLLTVAIMLPLVFVSDAPFSNPAPSEPEFVFSFLAHGDWLESAPVTIADPQADQRPVHMRTTLPAKRGRSPVTIRLEIDGRMQEHVFRPKGFKSDGASVGELRTPLVPGTHHVHVTVITGPGSEPHIWSGEVIARERRLNVLTYASTQGFLLED